MWTVSCNDLFLKNAVNPLFCTVITTLSKKRCLETSSCIACDLIEKRNSNYRPETRLQPSTQLIGMHLPKLGGLCLVSGAIYGDCCSYISNNISIIYILGQESKTHVSCEPVHFHYCWLHAQLGKNTTGYQNFCKYLSLICLLLLQDLYGLFSQLH